MLTELKLVKSIDTYNIYKQDSKKGVRYHLYAKDKFILTMFSLASMERFIVEELIEAKCAFTAKYTYSEEAFANKPNIFTLYKNGAKIVIGTSFQDVVVRSILQREAYKPDYGVDVVFFKDIP